MRLRRSDLRVKLKLGNDLGNSNLRVKLESSFWVTPRLYVFQKDIALCLDLQISGETPPTYGVCHSYLETTMEV
jgi:hypothetical protein